MPLARPCAPVWTRCRAHGGMVEYRRSKLEIHRGKPQLPTKIFMFTTHNRVPSIERMFRDAVYHIQNTHIFQIPNSVLYVTSAMTPPTQSWRRVLNLPHFPHHQRQSHQAPLKNPTTLRTIWTSRILVFPSILPVYRP
jgi:hypothetical protein